MLTITTPHGNFPLSDLTPKDLTWYSDIEVRFPKYLSSDPTNLPDLWKLWKLMWKNPQLKFLDPITSKTYHVGVPTTHINTQFILEYHYLRTNGYTGLANRMAKHWTYGTHHLTSAKSLAKAKKRSETFFIDMLNIFKDMLYEVLFDRETHALTLENEYKLYKFREFYKEHNLSGLDEYNTTITPYTTSEILWCDVSFSNQGSFSRPNYRPHFAKYKQVFSPVSSHVDEVEAKLCNTWLKKHNLAERSADEQQRRNEYIIANHGAFMDAVSSLTREEAQSYVKVYVNSGLYEEWFNITRQAGEETHGQIERFGTNIPVNLPESSSSTQYQRITNYLINQPEDLIDDEFVANVRNTLRRIK